VVFPLMLVSFAVGRPWPKGQRLSFGSTLSFGRLVLYIRSVPSLRGT
jgi:hypothetical protein